FRSVVILRYLRLRLLKLRSKIFFEFRLAGGFLGLPGSINGLIFFFGINGLIRCRHKGFSNCYRCVQKEMGADTPISSLLSLEFRPLTRIGSTHLEKSVHTKEPAPVHARNARCPSLTSAKHHLSPELIPARTAR